MLRFDAATCPLPDVAPSDLSTRSDSCEESQLWPFLHRSRLNDSYQVPPNLIAQSVKREPRVAAPNLLLPLVDEKSPGLAKVDLLAPDATYSRESDQIPDANPTPIYVKEKKGSVCDGSSAQISADPLPPGSFCVPWRVPLSQLRFYQDYISSTFTNGRPLPATIQELRDGIITPESIPHIEALFHRGVWYGMGNRRLACFFMVFAATDPHRLIPVIASHIPDDEDLMNQGDGRQVRVGCGLQTEHGVIVDYKRPSV